MRMAANLRLRLPNRSHVALPGFYPDTLTRRRRRRRRRRGRRGSALPHGRRRRRRRRVAVGERRVARAASSAQSRRGRVHSVSSIRQETPTSERKSSGQRLSLSQYVCVPARVCARVYPTRKPDHEGPAPALKRRPGGNQKTPQKIFSFSLFFSRVCTIFFYFCTVKYCKILRKLPFKKK